MHTMESKDKNHNRKRTKARMHSSDSSSGVLQPTAITNKTHPHLSTTLLHVDEKTGFHRMWAQLKKEQGSPLDKTTLEAEYNALQPNEHQEWERRVQEFFGTSTTLQVTKELHKEIISEVVELGRMPREYNFVKRQRLSGDSEQSERMAREAILKSKIRKHNLDAWAKRELKSRSIPYVCTRLTKKTSASSPVAQLKSLCMDGRAPSRGHKRKDIHAGLISHTDQESEEVDRTTTEDASIDLGWTWYLPAKDQAIFKFVHQYGRPLETKKRASKSNH